MILLSFILDALQYALYAFFEVCLIFWIVQPPPIVSRFKSLIILSAITVRTDYISALELKQRTFRVAVEYLHVYIVSLLQLNKFYDVKIAGQFLLSAHECTVFPLSHFLFSRALAACGLPLLSTAPKIGNFAKTVH